MWKRFLVRGMEIIQLPLIKLENLFALNDMSADPSDLGSVQTLINNELKSKQIEWRKLFRKQRALSDSVIKKYQGSNSWPDMVSEASEKLFKGEYVEQKVIGDVAELEKRIVNFSLPLPAGQHLYRGANLSSPCIESAFREGRFLSTTLSPVVAILHAKKRELKGGDAWILDITVGDNLTGLYITPQSLPGEWEVLFPCGANFMVNKILPATNSGCFRVAEVTLSSFDKLALS
jgi:ADP-ribosyltransferase exoenzyme